MADYTRSRFDSAPIAIGNYRGHVEDDPGFCKQMEQLKAEAMFLLEQIGDPTDYQRLVAGLERRTRSIPPGMSPGWNGILRCRCWWDAKDEVLEIADYLEKFTTKTESRVRQDQTEAGCVQKRVTIVLLGEDGMARTIDCFGCLFSVSVVAAGFVGQPREDSETDSYRMQVRISDFLMRSWSLDSRNTKIDVVKVLFEHTREYVVERLQRGLPLEDQLLLTAQNSPDRCPYDISRIVDPATSVPFVVDMDSQSSSQQEQKIELYVDDIDSFRKVLDVQPQQVKALLPLNLSEDAIQEFFEDIIGENFHQKDWGGEQNDLATSQIKVSGRRIRAAFLLKGNGTRGKLTIAKCGKNGDQIVRLVEAHVDLYVIQHIGEIDQRVISDLRVKVEQKISVGQECQMCILNGTDTARILLAYGKLDRCFQPPQEPDRADRPA